MRDPVFSRRGRKNKGGRGLVERKETMGTGRKGKREGVMGGKGLMEGFLQSAAFGAEEGTGLCEAFFAYRFG